MAAESSFGFNCCAENSRHGTGVNPAPGYYVPSETWQRKWREGCVPKGIAAESDHEHQDSLSSNMALTGDCPKNSDIPGQWQGDPRLDRGRDLSTRNETQVG